MGFQLPEIDPAKRAFTLLEEFKSFAFKGNAIDLAVGIIIGGAFQTIVKSLVDNVLMPIISGIASGGKKLNPGEKAIHWFDWMQFEIGDVKVPIGAFLADVVQFLLMAFILFLIIQRILAWVLRFRAQQAAAPPPPPPDVALLTEIRDLLKAQAIARPQQG